MSFRHKEVTLGELCTLGDGAHTKVKRVESGIPYLTSKNIKNGYLDLSNVDYMSNEDHEKLFGISQKSVRHLQEGDVLIGIIGTLGNTYLYKNDDKFGVSSSIGIIRPNKNLIDSKYLYYCLSSNRFKQYTEMYKGGSVQGYTNLPTLRKIPVYLPPIKEQKAIAKILSDLDDKIEVNNKTNKNLEDMAQAIFKHWFVDFEFPNDEGKPYKSSGGEMVDSELGMIPKGWEVVELDEIISVNKRGFSPKYSEQGIKVINQRCVRNHNLIDEAIQYHDLNQKKVPEDVYLKSKDILINSMGVGTLGRVAQKTIVKEQAIIHSCITIIRANESKVSPYFLGQYFISIEKELENMGIGSTGQTSLKNKDLAKMKLILPSRDIQDKANEILMNISIKIDSNLEENKKLSNLRDTLLPKLMSGEIRVPID